MLKAPDSLTDKRRKWRQRSARCSKLKEFTKLLKNLNKLLSPTIYSNCSSSYKTGLVLVQNFSHQMKNLVLVQ